MQVSFRISQKTLERLEWEAILVRLAERARTPLGRRRILGDGSGATAGLPLFEPDATGVRARLTETREARALLDAGHAPPLGGVAGLDASLARARKGGALGPVELLEVASTLAALHESARFLGQHTEEAPGLAALAETVAPQAVLRAELEGCLDPAGEVRDEASAQLADARREVRRLSSEIQSRLSRTLQDPSVQGALSDSYFTVRNDRYVLPVRADSRGSVRGIVHDASRSGTTLFVEPEALVELNNRHKQAELTVEQETRRVLRELSGAVAEVADEIEGDLDTLAGIDLAFARAELAGRLEGVEPEVGDEGVICLPLLRHPLIDPAESVPNDVRLGESFTCLVLSGPNAGGKTVTMKSVALAVLFVRAGLFVPAQTPARVDLFDTVLADIGDEQDIREHLSTFSAHMANLARIVDAADERSLVVLDEIGVGTDPGEGASIAQAALESLASAGARILTTTHYSLLKEMAEVDDRFANASVGFDAETLAPTFRLEMGLPGASSATAVAARMGLRSDVLERAEALLAREDRHLDRMLSELGASRAALEREQREARRLHAESEDVRHRYQKKLERLGERRDELYRSMRAGLDEAFRDAHEQVAQVVRDVQRGGTAQEAARARESLLAIEEKARQEEEESGLAPEAPAPPRPVDWNRARPGDPLVVVGAGPAVLVALPDRRGRVAVRLGSARVLIPRERVGSPAPGSEPPPQPRGGVRLPSASAQVLGDAGAGRCDLRGLRVDEALDRLVESLDRAASDGRDELVVVHGIGTGALRRAVREHLARSPYVARFLPGAPEEGGEGVTTAHLEVRS